MAFDLSAQSQINLKSQAQVVFIGRKTAQVVEIGSEVGGIESFHIEENDGKHNAYDRREEIKEKTRSCKALSEQIGMESIDADCDDVGLLLKS